MHKKFVLFYFSGTGNTKAVSEMLCEELNKVHGNETDLVSIETFLRNPDFSILEQAHWVGIAYPIYGLGTPAIVTDFIKVLTHHPISSYRFFLLLTAADFIGINHHASSIVKKLLLAYRAEVIYERIIVMGANWLMEYDPRLNKQLYEAAKKKAQHMATELQSGVERKFSPNLFLRFLADTIHYFEANHGALHFGQSLRTSSKCTHCGKCVKACPRMNITQSSTAVSFGSSCIMCMRCVYLCPVKAIQSKGMQFVIQKNGYDLNRVLAGPGNDGLFITKSTKGFFKHFIRYLEDASL